MGSSHDSRYMVCRFCLNQFDWEDGSAQSHDTTACELKVRKQRMQPPVGVSPRNIAETQFSRQRAAEILEAMRRYSDAEKAIPREWVDELAERLEHVNSKQ